MVRHGEEQKQMWVAERASHQRDDSMQAAAADVHHLVLVVCALSVCYQQAISIVAVAQAACAVIRINQVAQPRIANDDLRENACFYWLSTCLVVVRTVS